MISSTLAALGKELSQAASRRRYPDVVRLAAKAGEAAAAEARTLPAGDAGVDEIAAWLTALYHRTEILLRIARAAHADDLRQVTFLRGYLPSTDHRAEHVRMAL